MWRRSGLYLRQHYGRGSGEIWLENLRCTGYENSLAECPHNGWGVNNCGHHEDVSIICGYGKCVTQHLKSMSLILHCTQVICTQPLKNVHTIGSHTAFKNMHEPILTEITVLRQRSSKFIHWFWAQMLAYIYKRLLAVVNVIGSFFVLNLPLEFDFCCSKWSFLHQGKTQAWFLFIF